MTKAQLEAILIVAILQFALLENARVYLTTLDIISNLIVFIPFSLCMMKINITGVKNLFLMTVIELYLCIIILASMLCFWRYVVNLVPGLVQSAFAIHVKRSKVIKIADFITLALAVFFFLMVLIEEKVFQKAVDYFRKKRCRQNRQCQANEVQANRDPDDQFHRDAENWERFLKSLDETLT